MSLVPSFTVQLSQKPLVNTVGVGKLDGVHPTLVGATANGKVFLHTSHQSGTTAIGGRVQRSEVADVTLLNINQTVKCVAVGCMQEEGASGVAKDILVIGTASHVLAYDVDNNSDLFYREVTDGVNVMTLGTFAGMRSPLVMCGGNCAIQAFDAHGRDVFWTVTGDNVTAMCLTDYDGDGRNELIVGSDDYDIRVFKNDEIIDETNESDAIVCLAAVDGSRFAYALANGTLGVYEKMERIWRIKSKNTVICMRLYDIDGDDQLELVVGWSNGKIDFRDCASGEVAIKEQMGHGIAGIAAADYRLDGRTQLICMSKNGEVRGFLPPNEGGLMKQADPSQEIIHDFGLTKQNLLMELNNYEQNQQISEQGGELSAEQRAKMGAIPANTHLQTTLYVNAGSPPSVAPCIELYVGTVNETIVRAVMVFAEGIFPGESHVLHPNVKQVGQECRVQMRPQKDLQVELHVKAFVGLPNSYQYHVFELSRTLPRFSMYALCFEEAPQPDSYCTFQVAERPARLALWVNENFLLQEQVDVDEKTEALDARFFSLRGAGMLFIQMTLDGIVFVRCDDMDLCANVVTAIAQFMNISHLASWAEFPAQIDRCVELVEKVNEIYLVRDQLTGDVADLSSLIKGLLIRAEDARLMGDMASMKKYYTQLHSINQELITQYKVRQANHEELLANLKHVNQIIQRAGRLRVGKPKTAVINACRECIQTSNHESLPKIIRFGAE